MPRLKGIASSPRGPGPDGGPAVTLWLQFRASPRLHRNSRHFTRVQMPHDREPLSSIEKRALWRTRMNSKRLEQRLDSALPKPLVGGSSPPRTSAPFSIPSKLQTAGGTRHGMTITHRCHSCGQPTKCPFLTLLGSKRAPTSGAGRKRTVCFRANTRQTGR